MFPGPYFGYVMELPHLIQGYFPPRALNHSDDTHTRAVYQTRRETDERVVCVFTYREKGDDGHGRHGASRYCHLIAISRRERTPGFSVSVGAESGKGWLPQGTAVPD